MERRYNLRPRTSGRAQTSSTIQLSSYSHNAPPAGTSPSSDIHCLRQALFSAEEHNMELAAEITALKQQLVSHTDQTQQRELHATKSELKKALDAAKQTQDLLKRKEKLILESHRELSSLRETLKGQTKDLHFSSTQLCLKDKQLNEALTRCSSLEEKLREELIKREKKEIELSSLGESLTAQKEETNLWVNRYKEVKAALEEETKHSADLQYQRELTQKEISSVRSEIQARTEENQVLSATLDLRENELIQNISRYNALEEKHNIELLLRQSLERELSSLQESLTAQKEETNLWVNKYKEVKAALEEETKHSADLQYQRELTQKEISSVRSEIQARTEENQVLSATLDLRENELIQNISRYNALEEKHNIELLLRQSLERELSSLQESLTAQKEETNLWVNKYKEVKAALEEETQSSAEWEQCHRELTTELKTRTEEIQVLSSNLTLREEDLKENIRRCHALEEDCKKQLMERQQNWESRQQEEQKLWAEKEEALMKQVSKAEEEVKSLIIQNIGLQELALKKNKKKKTRGSWRRRSKKNSSVEEEEAPSSSAEDGDANKKKNEKKERKRSFWRRRPKRSSEEDEPQAEDGQEEEVKERRGFWRWTSRKRRSNGERAAPDKQQ
ncbi:golgin subfamily A member 6-like protein 1 isoform X2 [Lates calcarifer]|uniref:Golgin subfamily A member 6-like protein 1 isoform X2 n=1 Tax=Lates calcarifer TaxID=8187 RepID=A0AAJ8AWK6_LATCA|nr:golgin subfamily A member 6-like protein 1 isoform X2 [Lates calcarifer]